MYADDSNLFFTSAKSLQELISCVHEDNKLDLTFIENENCKHDTQQLPKANLSMIQCLTV